MTSQLQGEILYGGWAGTGTANTWVYTPWMPVLGDVATFAVEVISIVDEFTLSWDVETRTRESASVTSVFNTAPTGITATGVHVDTNDDTAGPDVKAKELVRYKFATGSSASATDFVVFRALPPSWQTNR